MRTSHIAITAILLTAACGGSKPSTAEETPAAQPASSAAPATPAQAAQQMAQGLQALTQNPNQTATPVDFEKLIELLPEAPAGWTRSKPKGGQHAAMGFAVSQAEAEYEKGEASIHLEFTDTSFNQSVMAPYAMMMAMGYSERTSDGYKKAAALGGSPGFETWENEAKAAEVTVVVGNRIIVAAKGRNVDNADPVRALVQAVDQGKLKDLK